MSDAGIYETMNVNNCSEYFTDITGTKLFPIRTFDLNAIYNMNGSEVLQVKKDIAEETERLHRCIACAAFSNDSQIIFGCGPAMIENHATRIFVLNCRLSRLESDT